MIIAAAAYLVAIVFLLPYLEILVTALRPQRVLLYLVYLPHHSAWSYLTGMWGAGFGITSSLRVSLEVAGGATILVTLVALPAAYYTPGTGSAAVAVPAARAYYPDAAAYRTDRLYLQVVPLLPPDLHALRADPGERSLLHLVRVWILNAYFASIPAEI